jgi:hypothetical protein
MSADLVLFAFSWIDILLLLGAIYLLVVVLRGLRDLAFRVYESFVIEPREEERRRQLREQKRRENE